MLWIENSIWSIEFGSCWIPSGRYEAKYPKAVASLQRDEQHLFTFFDFLAEHWRHLRTSNAIESAFATVRLRQQVTKGPGSRNKGLAMAFKLLEMAQLRWRRINGAELLPLVWAGQVFMDGILVQTTEKKNTEGRTEAA